MANASTVKAAAKQTPIAEATATATKAPAGQMHTMLEACEAAGLTYQTLKFYCNEGLVPGVKRDNRNRRVFDDHTLAWIKDLACLKRCNFSIAEMKTYLALCLQGEKTIPQRQKILERKRAELVDQVKQLNDSIDYIDWKQGFYNDVRTGKTPYVSNLLP